MSVEEKETIMAYETVTLQTLLREIAGRTSSNQDADAIRMAADALDAFAADVRRDERVRAAEDAAAVPAIQHRDLPEQVALLWASLGDIIGRVVRLEGEMDAGQDEEAAPAEGMRKERGESVRVVEETKRGRLPDMVARLTAERDAAIRERDEAKEECERLRAKIVAMEGQSRMETEAEIAVEEAWERCGIAPYWPDDEPGTSHRYAKSMEAEIVRLRARVAELEAAAAVRPMGWIARHEQSPPVGKYVMCRWDVSACPGYAREVGYGVAKRGPDGMWRAPNGVEKIAPMHWMPLLPGVEGGDAWEAPLASAPAANAGGYANNPHEPESLPEQVAFMMSGPFEKRVFLSREEVYAYRRKLSPIEAASVIFVPLYDAPPPRGWMTAEEREEVQGCLRLVRQETSLLEQYQPDHPWMDHWLRTDAALSALLARETPPKVKRRGPWTINGVPGDGSQAWKPMIDAILSHRDDEWIAAIRAAGGEVEE